jgi:predicted Zn-dependent peptidase
LDALTKSLNKGHKSSKKKLALPTPIKFTEKEIDEDIVYFVDYDMVQAEVIFLSKSKNYDPSLVPTAKLFNEYFGGNMGSIVFQEMREAQALAYSVRSYYSVSGEKDKPSYVVSYIGTQADKLNNAIVEMQKLLNNMPESQTNFQQAIISMKSTLESGRITKSGILFSYEKAKKLGIDYDIREQIYNFLKNASFEDIQKFQQAYIKQKKQAILVIGSKENIDLKDLEKYGKVKRLSLEQLFGY